MSCYNTVIYVGPEMKCDVSECAGDSMIAQLPPFDMRVGSYALTELRNIKLVELQEGLEAIGDGWFVCSEVQTVAVPQSVKYIGEHAFGCCR